MARGNTYPPAGRLMDNGERTDPVMFYFRDGRNMVIAETRVGEAAPEGYADVYYMNPSHHNVWSTIDFPEHDRRHIYVNPDGTWQDWVIVPINHIEPVTPNILGPVWEPTTQPVTPPTPPPPPNPIIRVIVRRDGTYNRWRIEVYQDGAQLDIPTIDIIKRLVPKEWKKHLSGSRRWGSVRALGNAIDAGVPSSIIHDALKAWAFARATAGVAAESSSPLINDDDAFLLRAQPANLIVGGKVYRLVPTGEVNIKPLIGQVRRKALELAKVEADALRVAAANHSNEVRQRAEIDGRTVVRQAEDRAARIRQEIETARRQETVRPPSWAVSNGVGMKYVNGSWHIAFYCPTIVTGIRFRVIAWHATLWWNPLEVVGHGDRYYRSHPMKMWVPIGPAGQFDIGAIYSDNWPTTHIHRTGTCLDMQGLPARIDSLANLEALRLVIQRGLEVVNLNSPLNTDVPNYYPPFLEQLPKVIQAKLMGNWAVSPGAGVGLVAYREQLPPDQRWARHVTDVEELAETFTVTAAVEEARNA